MRRLPAAGAHRVFTPTPTGVGERSHLLSRDVDLGTHVADVANLLIWEDLRDIVLVGHSYGGVVARHVADRMPDRIRSLVYLDAEPLVSYRTNRQLSGWNPPPLETRPSRAHTVTVHFIVLSFGRPDATAIKCAVTVI